MYLITQGFCDVYPTKELNFKFEVKKSSFSIKQIKKEFTKNIKKLNFSIKAENANT